MWWNDALKPVIKIKEDSWNQVLGVRDEATKANREEKRKDKEVYTYITAKRR